MDFFHVVFCVISGRRDRARKVAGGSGIVAVGERSALFRAWECSCHLPLRDVNNDAGYLSANEAVSRPYVRSVHSLTVSRQFGVGPFRPLGIARERTRSTTHLSSSLLGSGIQTYGCRPYLFALAPHRQSGATGSFDMLSGHPPEIV